MSRKKLLIQIASLLLTIICAVCLIEIPSGSEHPFLFGFSFVRILLLACFLLAGTIQSIVFFCIKSKKYIVHAANWVNKLHEKKIWLIFLIAILFISWYFTFLPIEHFSGNQAIFTRIKPAILWIFGQTVLWFCGWLFHQEKNGLRKFKFDKNEIRQGGFFIFFALGIWILIARTKFGLTPDIFWDNLGVPITIAQVGLAFLFTLIIFKIAKKYLAKLKHIEIYLFFLLWIVAAAVWISEPQHTSTFNPGPFLPNNEFYPNSDAQTYDTCALSSLLGQNYCFFNKNAVSKPLYIAFLFLLHLFSGNDYTLLVNLQVIFIAVLPPILFLIGRQLHSNLLGILVAILSIIKITNSIADSLIIWTVSNPKFMMSESFLAVFLALLCLFMIIWYQNPNQKRIYLYLSGAILGLCTLIRDNVWILLPCIALVVLLRSDGKIWNKLSHAVSFILVFALAFTPWAVRNMSLGLKPISLFESLEQVIFENRYGIEGDDQSSIINVETSTNSLIESGVDLDTGEIQYVSYTENAISETLHFPITQTNTDSSEQESSDISSIYFSTINHFLHNILSVFFTLPMNYRTSSVEDTITKTWEINPWTRTWDGTVERDVQIMMALNIFILCLGIIGLYRKSKTAYCIPLIIMIVYLAGVAFAKTSGGRYIVPVDWIMLIFYAAGLLFIMETFGIHGKINNGIKPENDSIEETTGSSNKMATVLLAALLGIGILVPISENIFSEKHFPQTYTEFLNEVEQNGYEMDADYFSSSEVEKFLEEENAVFVAGEGFYPKLLDPADENAREFFNDYLHEPYTLLFTLLNEKTSMPVYLPVSTNQISFSHGATVSILGCKESSGKIRALSILILGRNIEIINSENLKSLSCKK
ncbi:MAG: ArnT family glycosyltransferase [Anaerolineaceae bacterium]